MFDEHPAVLLGVNESIPRFGELVDALEEHAARLDVRLLVTVRRDTLRRWLRRGDSRLWPLSAAKQFASASGSISLRVRVEHPLPLRPTTQSAIALRADEYARVLSDHDAAIGRLLPLLPESCVDRAFPGSRFELLNGWRKPPPSGEFRTGYRRARWFLTRRADAAALRFDVRSTNGNAARLHAYVSGARATTVTLHDRWSDVAVPLTGVPPGSRFVCELRVELAEPEDGDFNAFCFDVRQRRFA